MTIKNKITALLAALTLSKKKIEDITATILDWEKVVAGDDNVQIK